MEERDAQVDQWRATQKERERERRRMRDRQRRQSMSLEEREKHLARRRRNYQLRRQRAAVAQLGYGQAQQVEIKNDNLGLVCNVPEATAQDVGCSVQVAHGNASGGFSKGQALSTPVTCMVVSPAGESTFGRSYRYPRMLRLVQIKRLARSLNSQGQRPCAIGQETEAHLTYKEITSPQSTMKRGMRLIHVKRLARALSSSNANNLCAKG